MPIPVEELIQYTQFTWSSILDVDVEQIHEEFVANPDTDINACVLISGAWKGMVVTSFHSKLAQAVAKKMFDLKEQHNKVKLKHKKPHSVAYFLLGEKIGRLLPFFRDLDDNSWIL